MEDAIHEVRRPENNDEILLEKKTREKNKNLIIIMVLLAFSPVMFLFPPLPNIRK